MGFRCQSERLENPDEFLNCDLKTTLSSKRVAHSKSELKKTIISQMRALQKEPNRIKKYFQAEYKELHFLQNQLHNILKKSYKYIITYLHT